MNDTSSMEGSYRVQSRRSSRLMSLVVGLLLAAALGGCRSGDDRPFARCLDGLDPALLGVDDLPRPTGMITGSSVSSRNGATADAEHESYVEVDDPSATLIALCRQLEAELAVRCAVRRESTGPSHCAFSVSSSYRSTTGEDGIHDHRRMTGRVHLLAEPAENGPPDSSSPPPSGRAETAPAGPSFRTQAPSEVPSQRLTDDVRLRPSLFESSPA